MADDQASAVEALPDQSSDAREAELRRLSVRYASGVDRRDRDTFLAAFHPDGSLTVHRDGDRDGTGTTLRGHAELARVVELIDRYPRTYHFLGQSSYQRLGAGAGGEVHCTAHHLEPGGSTTLVMFIRYQDRYERGHDGSWRISARHVVVDWQERHAHAEAGTS